MRRRAEAACERAATAEDAADVVAETFLAAWRRLETVPDPPEARLWLYATARRVLANQRRGQQRYQRLAARLRDDRASRYGSSPVTVAVDDRDTSVVTGAFGRLKAGPGGARAGRLGRAGPTRTASRSW